MNTIIPVYTIPTSNSRMKTTSFGHSTADVFLLYSATKNQDFFVKFFSTPRSVYGFSWKRGCRRCKEFMQSFVGSEGAARHLIDDLKL